MAKPQQRIERQQEQGNKLGARGTPAFFINGRFLSGAQPLPAFQALIDEGLQKARKLVREGTNPNRVYDKIIEKGKTKP